MLALALKVVAVWLGVRGIAMIPMYFHMWFTTREETWAVASWTTANLVLTLGLFIVLFLFSDGTTSTTNGDRQNKE